MITLAFLILLLLANGMLAWFAKARVFPVEGWVSPLAFWLPFYLLNYPVRAVVLYLASGTALEFELNSQRYDFEPAEIAIGLLYATLFATILLGIYVILCRGRSVFDFQSCVRTRGTAVTAWQKTVLNVVFGVYLAAFGYRAITNSLFTLYEEMDDLKRSSADNVVALLDVLKWPLLAFGFLRLLDRKTPSALLYAGVGAATIVYGALVSTAKGEIVCLLVLWGVCFWLKRGKLPLKQLALGAVVIAAFSLYSMTVRMEGTVTKRGAEAENAFSDNQTRAADHYADNGIGLEEIAVVSSRLSYLDAIILAQRKGTFLNEGPYLLGSLVEFGNVVPRALWPDRPLLSFNHEMTYAVWSMPDWEYFLEMPIGRIGESFFVLNWMGVLYAVFYAAIWSWIYHRFFVMAHDDLSRAFYLSVLILFIFPDAYVVYNWKLLLVLTAAGYLLGVRFAAGARQSKPDALLDGPGSCGTNNRSLGYRMHRHALAESWTGLRKQPQRPL
ncbi:MAG: hypothetical protein ABSG68_10815 [Thermoguttaceae bacterium]|jgi:hypothetical protein